MSKLIAENVGLELPLYTSARRGLAKDKSASKELRDGRFLNAKNGVPKSFQVLSEISFSLQQGDRLGIVGNNGSGKSTLLKVLGGVLTPTTGKLQVEGSVRGIFNLNLGINPQATGYRNIILIGLVAGLSRKEIEARVPEIAEFSELGQFLYMPVHTYSSGMRMRLLFATATSLRPDILLMDEWLGTGDQAFKAKASERMQQMVKDAGIVVIASHAMNLIRDNCNKVIWLNKGKAQQYGDVEDVLNAFQEG